MAGCALVTGATGFIGSRLVRRLVAGGWRVAVVVRSTSALTALGDLTDRVAVYRCADNQAALRSAVAEARPDQAFHLAGHYVGDAGANDLAPLIEANVGFTARLADALADSGVTRLVAAGTGWQHCGPAGIDAPAPNGLYAATKQAGEELLRHYAHNRRLAAVVLKILDSYGPDDPRGKLASRLATAARSGEHLAMSPGDQRIGLVHVEDIVDAFLAAAERLACGANAAPLESFVLAPAYAPTLKELVVRFAEITGTPVNVEFGALPYRDFEVMRPLEGPVLPGWSPRIALDDGLHEMLKAAS